MTRRIIALKGSDGYYISQEFNGDRNEATLLRGFAVVQANWNDIVPMFHGATDFSSFSRSVERAEELYGYEKIPLEIVEKLPSVQELWLMVCEDLTLFSEYGEGVKQNGMSM